MLEKKHRLKKEIDFKRVFRTGQKMRSNYFGLFWAKNKRPISRVGIIVSNKVSKKAAKRNSNKRIIREEIKKLDLLEKNPGKDIVIKLNKEITKENKGAALKELELILNKLK